jgi:hypothetical protein
MTPEQLSAAVTGFLDGARQKAAGGLTVAEFGSLVVELLRLAVTGLEEIPADGPAKKAWALGVIGNLFDAVAGFAVPLYLQPFWILARPAVRALVLAAAAGALEQILTLTRAAAPEPTA